MNCWDQMPWSSFFKCWVLRQLFHSPLSSKRLFTSSMLSAIRVVSSAYQRLLIFLPAILILAYALTSPAFCKMWQYTARTYSFPNLEPVRCSMSASNCCFLTCIQISQETGKVIWYFRLFKNFPQFAVIHKQLRLAWGCPGVSGGGVGRQWPAAGSGHWIQ